MKVVVVHSLSEKNYAELANYADDVVVRCTGNSLLTGTEFAAQVTKTKAASTGLKAVQLKPYSSSKTAEMKAARDTLEREITKLGNRVEDIANDPIVAETQRVVIVHSAGMELKGYTRPDKRHFAVFPGDVPGTVKVTAQAGAVAHQWQYTYDVKTFANRVEVDPTTKSTVIISNLTSRKEVAVFHRAIIADTPSSWEGPLVIFVE